MDTLDSLGPSKIPPPEVPSSCPPNREPEVPTPNMSKSLLELCRPCPEDLVGEGPKLKN